MKKAEKLIAILALTLLQLTVFAQTEGVSIKTTVGPPHASAMLDVESSSKGVLIPRVVLMDTNSTTSPVSSPAEGLLVYNTSAGGNATKGFYYFTGSKWRKISTAEGDLWKKVPSTNQDITYDNGKVFVQKPNLASGARFFLRDQSVGGAGPMMIFNSTNPSYTNICEIHHHPWSGGGGNLLHVSFSGTTGVMEVNGKVRANSFSTMSDSTLKTNIETITEAIDKITSLRGVSYKYKTLSENEDDCSSDNHKIVLDGDTHTGVIAQEVEAVFPNAVETVNGKKSVMYMELIGPLIQAVKEQQQIIQDLQQRVQILEQQ